MPWAGFELGSLGPQAGVQPIEPPLPVQSQSKIGLVTIAKLMLLASSVANQNIQFGSIQLILTKLNHSKCLGIPLAQHFFRMYNENYLVL